MKDDSMTTPPRHITLSVLFFQEPTAEGTAWVAQALQHDLAAQGPTIERANQAFLETLAAQFRLDQQNNRPPLSDLEPAPEEYWNAFDRAMGYQLVTRPLMPRIKSDVTMPPAYMIQAITDAPGLHRH